MTSIGAVIVRLLGLDGELPVSDGVAFSPGSPGNLSPPPMRGEPRDGHPRLENRPLRQELDRRPEDDRAEYEAWAAFDVRGRRDAGLIEPPARRRSRNWAGLVLIGCVGIALSALAFGLFGR